MMTADAGGHFSDTERRVFVGAITGSLRNDQAELRLDSCNGFNKFIWISRGAGRFMMNGVTRNVGANTLLYVPFDVPHRLEVGHSLFGTIVATKPTISATLPEAPILLPILNLMDQKQVSNRFDRIMSEYNVSGIGQNTAVECLVGLLTVQATRMVMKLQKPEKITASQRLMLRFSQMLERDFRTGRPLAEYAVELGVTPTHLTRVCRQMNGKSASRMIQERVLCEASAMLKETDHKILEISDRLGFSSPAYFTRLFSMKLGKTPKEFRQSSSRH